jgi:hypothetical protein
MNLLCPVCAEPWYFDSLHEAAAEQGKTYQQIARLFQTKGCEAIGERHSKHYDEADKRESEGRAMIASAVYDVMGDDMDGAASEFDDLGW